MKAQKKTDSPKPEKPSADIPTFRWNDELVTEQLYSDQIKDHEQWVVSLENLIVEDIPAKPAKRSKKK